MSNKAGCFTTRRNLPHCILRPARRRKCGERAKRAKKEVPMFPSRTSKIVTALCALIGAAAFVGDLVLALTGGPEYAKFALAMVLCVAFLVGSYWWVVFGPGGRT